MRTAALDIASPERLLLTSCGESQLYINIGYRSLKKPPAAILARFSTMSLPLFYGQLYDDFALDSVVHVVELLKVILAYFMSDCDSLKA
jgi:hypothetical protein